MQSIAWLFATESIHMQPVPPIANDKNPTAPMPYYSGTLNRRIATRNFYTITIVQPVPPVLALPPPAPPLALLLAFNYLNGSTIMIIAITTITAIASISNRVIHSLRAST